MADLDRLYANVQQAILEMEFISRNITSEVKNALPLLALRLARLMVSHAARTNPEIVLATLAAALRRAQELDVINVRLNPEDIDTVAGYLKTTPALAGQIENLPLDQDPAIERGGCIIETSAGVVDATHANQFSTLMEQFQAVKDMDRPSRSPLPVETQAGVK
jgi:flagellar assembly protein FliH